MEYFWYALLGVCCAFFLFTVIRTVCTRRPKAKTTDVTQREIPADRVVKKLQDAVRIPTVTRTSNDLDHSEFLKYQAYLEETFPFIMQRAEKTLVNGYAVIYRLKGTDETRLPIAVLAHQDVVPATDEGWDVPPFSGEIKENCVYGRGSQDMKSQMIAALEGLELLLEEGKEPKRGVYFCFGHDEELRGVRGAKQIVSYLKEQNVRFEYVIDEGGTILDGKILGIDNKIALIGVCEKGYADIKIEVEKSGGHASSPTRRTAVGLLGEALYAIERNPFPSAWTEPTKQMLKALAPHMNPIFKYFFVNRDVFSPLLKWLLTIVSPFTACLMHTTAAPTRTAGSDAPNVLPGKATANINCRINTGETVESTKEYLQKVVGKKVRVSVEDGAIDPSPVSHVNSDAYRTLTDTIYEVFDGYISAPYPFIAASDAKYYYALTDNVYRFTPFEKTVEDANRIHALNERQNIDELVRGTKFFLRLYENSLF